MVLKREWCFVLGMLVALAVLAGVKAFADNQKDWWNECDEHFGYPTSYYTCRNYHIKGE